MIELVRSPDYEPRYYGPSGSTPCIVCGRPVRDNSNPAMLRIHYGAPGFSTVILTDAEAEAGYANGTLSENAEGGGWPIGPDCLRRHPEYKPYVNGGTT